MTRVFETAVPESVHKWKFLDGNTEHFKTATSIVDVRSLNLQNVFPLESTFILHYVSCGFYQWKSKYELLASFPDSWFGGKLKIHPCFHLESRDVVQRGNTKEMFNFYRSQVVLKDVQEIEKQLKSDLCLRLEEPSFILSQAKLKKQFQTTIDEELIEIINSQSENAKLDENEHNTQINNNTDNDRSDEIKENLSLDKMWIISSLVNQYLNTK